MTGSEDELTPEESWAVVKGVADELTRQKAMRLAEITGTKFHLFLRSLPSPPPLSAMDVTQRIGVNAFECVISLLVISVFAVVMIDYSQPFEYFTSVLSWVFISGTIVFVIVTITDLRSRPRNEWPHRRNFLSGSGTWMMCFILSRMLLPSVASCGVATTFAYIVMFRPKLYYPELSRLHRLWNLYVHSSVSAVFQIGCFATLFDAQMLTLESMAVYSVVALISTWLISIDEQHSRIRGTYREALCGFFVGAMPIVFLFMVLWCVDAARSGMQLSSQPYSGLRLIISIVLFGWGGSVWAAANGLREFGDDGLWAVGWRLATRAVVPAYFVMGLGLLSIFEVSSYVDSPRISLFLFLMAVLVPPIGFAVFGRLAKRIAKKHGHDFSLIASVERILASKSVLLTGKTPASALSH